MCLSLLSLSSFSLQPTSPHAHLCPLPLKYVFMQHAGVWNVVIYFNRTNPRVHVIKLSTRASFNWKGFGKWLSCSRAKLIDITTVVYQIAELGKCVAQTGRSNDEPVIRDPHSQRYAEFRDDCCCHYDMSVLKGWFLWIIKYLSICIHQIL